MPTKNTATHTIVAIATAAGAAGVGIIRLSGSRAIEIAAGLSATKLRPRHAHYVFFCDDQGETIDDGIALSFPAPASFTGEDVVELQAHGSPVLLQQLVNRCCQLGAQMARPGEFSERAFLNGKLDLTQAEAIADLIAAGDQRAARAARRSFEGVFSQRVEALAHQLLTLRIHIEAAIDFTDESLETLGGAQITQVLQQSKAQLDTLLLETERGRKLRDGWHVVLVGAPNVGKSSLLNALAGSDRAIVTEVAGTTRDTLHETIQLDGLELTLVDTAGLRDSTDAIEREGMRRAHAQLAQADVALIVMDAGNNDFDAEMMTETVAQVPHQLKIINKADLLPSIPEDSADTIYISALQNLGLDRLQARLKTLMLSHAGEPQSGEFSARARHVEALSRTQTHLNLAIEQWQHEQLELTAEELRIAFDTLGEITGRISADELLGKIFSSFCIGK